MSTSRSKKKLIGMPQMVLTDQKVVEIWSEIATAIVLIQEERMCRGMSFQELYDKANQLVTAQKIRFMYSSLTDVIRSHMLIVHHRLKSVEVNAILAAVLQAYKSHTSAMQRTRDLLLMMDSKRDSTRQSVLDLGFRLFIEHVLQAAPLPQKILDGMLQLIDATRAGETVNCSPLRSVTVMLLEVGGSMGHDRTQVYESIFLNGFLEHSQDYYRNLSQKHQAEMDVGSYLRWAERTLEREQSMAEASLNGPLTVEPLLRLLRAEILEAYKVDIVAAADVRGMVEGGDMNDLALMLKLFKHVDGGLKAVGDRVRQYISESCAATIEAEDVREGVKGAVKLIDVFCELVGKFYTMLTDKLNNDSEFAHTLNTAFGAVINTHARISEYLSIYIDHTIRNHIKDQTNGDIEKIFDRSIRLFRLLREKDVFERYYKQHLARRLLLVKASSDEAERMVISRLKAECGNQFTNRFEQMFKDIQISDDNMKAFSESLGGSAGVTKKIGKLDLDVRVLTTGMWPTQTTNPCILPPVLQAAASVYEEWYLTKHTGRKLTWQTTLGTMTLQARFPKGSKLLSVSTLQGVLLLLFNDTDGPISVTDMLARTEFELVAVVRALQSMSAGKHRVLIKTTEPDTAEIVEKDTFSVNVDFTSKMTKLKIAQGVAKESPPERAVTQDRVDEDRRLLMEAAIVRVMKHRRTLSHNELVIEATEMLASRFQPTPQMLKKRIERLIDADYLRRSAKDASVYEYMA
eukprot:m.105031 g.105031  ORF g.105031 m.105031 type:complete len:745 (+) comp10544_c0_seq6:258-2492(+)